MRTAAMMMVCAAALAACGGGDRAQDREQTGTASGRTDTATPARADSAPAGKQMDQPNLSLSPVSGQGVYGRTCVTCHQATGRGQPGTFPPLTGSEYVNGDKTRLIKLVLNGLTGPLTVNGQRYNGIMPPLKGQLNDAEVAAVLTYVRSNFGNTAGPVTEAEVRTQRAATAGRNTPFTVQELR